MHKIIFVTLKQFTSKSKRVRACSNGQSQSPLQKSQTLSQTYMCCSSSS